MDVFRKGTMKSMLGSSKTFTYALPGVSKSVSYAFKGTVVNNDEEKEKILQQAEAKKGREVVEMIIDQNIAVVNTVNDSYTKAEELNENLNREIMNVDSNLNKIKIAASQKGGFGDPFYQEIDKKITEMNVKKSNNLTENAKAKIEADKLEKKRKEHFDTLKNIGAERKVWLDQLDEKSLRELTYKDSFDISSSTDFEYKIFLLIFEGVLLEKVQDAIHRELARRGMTLGWDCMSEELELARRTKSEDTLKLRIETLSPFEKIREEEIWKREEESYLLELEKKKQVVTEEWKRYFKKFWEIKNISQLGEVQQDFDFNYNLYINTTKEVIFSYFKKFCFNAWHFKNLVLNGEEFILMETFKRYLLTLSERNVRADKEEEEALGILMAQITNFKDIAEILTIERRDRRQVLERVSQTVAVGEALKEVNEIKKNAGQKTIKRVKVPYLNDVFLPAMLAIRTITFMTIGNKRIKSYVDAVAKYKSESDSRNAQNSELEGQIRLLEEVKKRMGIDSISNKTKSQPQIPLEDSENDQKKSLIALTDIKKSLNQVKNLKNEIENNFNGMIKNVGKALLKPDAVVKQI